MPRTAKKSPIGRKVNPPPPRDAAHPPLDFRAQEKITPSEAVSSVKDSFSR